ncbi:MAG: hypothetical protein K0R09_993 [Clostridiales bacterium]|jgi:hypothetical protein|nr:hypothetical protein [Clostridiales bacterium]
MINLNKNSRCKCKKEKPRGRYVIISAILFENGVSEILSVEGKLINKLLERNESPWKLILLNKQIASILCCLRDFEEDIVEKIIKE